MYRNIKLQNKQDELEGNESNMKLKKKDGGEVASYVAAGAGVFFELACFLAAWLGSKLLP